MTSSERDETERDIPLMDLLDRWESPHKIQDSRWSESHEYRYLAWRKLRNLTKGITPIPLSDLHRLNRRIFLNQHR